MSDQKSMVSLNSVGVFIGTHGLAVFLVLYFTMKLYPTMQEERAKWIEDLAELKVMIDPESRPLAPRQAEAVLSVMSTVFLATLESYSQDLDRRFYVEFGKSYSDENGDDVTIDKSVLWIGGEQFLLPKASSDDAELENNFERQVSGIQNVFGRFEENYTRAAQEAYTYTKRALAVHEHQLGPLGFGERSLKDVWIRMVSEGEKAWNAAAGTSYVMPRVDRDRVLDYLSRHPSYDRVTRNGPELLSFFTTKGVQGRPPVEEVRATIEKIARETIELHRVAGGG